MSSRADHHSDYTSRAFDFQQSKFGEMHMLKVIHFGCQSTNGQHLRRANGYNMRKLVRIPPLPHQYVIFDISIYLEAYDETCPKSHDVMKPQLFSKQCWKLSNWHKGQFNLPGALKISLSHAPHAFKMILSLVTLRFTSPVIPFLVHPLSPPLFVLQLNEPPKKTLEFNSMSHYLTWKQKRERKKNVK